MRINCFFLCGLSNDEVKNLVNNKEAANTKRITETCFNVFLSYCKEKTIDFNPVTISKFNLNEILCKFYVEIRKHNGEKYKKSSYCAVKFAIQRRMKKIRGTDFDVIEDREFEKCNVIFKAQCVMMKKIGLCKTDPDENLYH